MQHLMDHDIIHHGKKEGTARASARILREKMWLYFYLQTLWLKKSFETVCCLFSVCDKRPVFKDAKLLYRFRKDDGTFPFSTEVKIFMRGQQLYEQ